MDVNKLEEASDAVDQIISDRDGLAAVNTMLSVQVMSLREHALESNALLNEATTFVKYILKHDVPRELYNKANKWVSKREELTTKVVAEHTKSKLNVV